jgi:hypothetical protein
LGCDRLETGLALWAGPELSGPTSFVAAEIHLGRGQQASTTTGRTATYKLRATPSARKYCFISNGSEPGLEIMKPVSLLLLEQIAQKLGDADE